jgi:hypothetical protein
VFSAEVQRAPNTAVSLSTTTTTTTTAIETKQYNIGELNAMRLRQSIDILFQKIHEASEELGRIVPNDVKKAIKVSKLIEKCANTLNILLNLKLTYEQQTNQ